MNNARDFYLHTNVGVYPDLVDLDFRLNWKNEYKCLEKLKWSQPDPSFFKGHMCNFGPFVSLHTTTRQDIPSRQNQILFQMDYTYIQSPLITESPSPFLLILANRTPLAAAFCSPFGGGRYKSCRMNKNYIWDRHTHIWDRARWSSKVKPCGAIYVYRLDLKVWFHRKQSTNEFEFPAFF